MSESLALVIGGVAGGFGLVFLATGLLWFYIIYCKNLSNKHSESSSSDAPTQGNKGGLSTLSELRRARQFALEELEEATKNFDENNLIGVGKFGSVYKGLLRDGTVVAIKMRQGHLEQEFVEEVHYLAEIGHRNLVTLIGYCQEAGLQMLIFEYVPNGSISGHLYGKESVTRLEFKRRISAAIGAAKGLSQLHSLIPPLIHTDFKTQNVLVDENFISKVADAGMIRLLQRIENAGLSQTPSVSVFRDPEVGNFAQLSESSDVYSFGVFLLELLTGQEAERLALSQSSENLTQWVESHLGSDNLIDPRLIGSFTSEGMSDFIRLTLSCLSSSGCQRPVMYSVVVELERILEMEMALTTVMGDGSTTVTLGSQLFIK